MSNLKALPWEDREGSAMVTTMFRGYWVTSDKESKGKFCVYYGSSTGEPARGFATVEDAKHWAEHEHYASEMQPYVVPTPTWISVDDRLPSESGRYMVVHQTTKPVKNKSTPVDIDSYDEKEKAWAFFRSGIMQEVTHWMPIPEFKQGE